MFLSMKYIYGCGRSDIRYGKRLKRHKKYKKTLDNYYCIEKGAKKAHYEPV